MKILKEKHTERSGNECVIFTSVLLIEFTRTNYLVISSEQYCGGWTNNEISNSTWAFKNIEEAYSKFDQVSKTF